MLQYQSLADDGYRPWSRTEAHIVIPCEFEKVDECFWYDVLEDRCFSVSSDDYFTAEEVAEHFDAVERGDRKEIQSFVSRKAFKLAPRDQKAHNRVDGTWVRKWADRSKRLVKSRMCARGFLDRQKKSIKKHSSTASRLSHRIACSLGVQHQLD